MLFGVLQRVGHEDLAADVLDAEGRKARGNVRIHELSRQRRRGKVLVEHVDVP